MTYCKGKMCISVTNLPKYSKKCLLISDDGHSYIKVATFTNDETAKEFENFIEAWG